MTSNSTSNFSSIFRDGKLQPGIYKIQNLYTETYLDIELHSRGVCCRPAKSIGEGRGLVRWCPSSVAYTSDNSKWEIKWLGPGYTVQRVSLPIPFNKICHRVNNVGCSSTQENPNSFVPHWMGSRMGPRCASALILWHGELKSSTMTIIVDSDMFGMTIIH